MSFGFLVTDTHAMYRQWEVCRTWCQYPTSQRSQRCHRCSIKERQTLITGTKTVTIGSNFQTKSCSMISVTEAKSLPITTPITTGPAITTGTSTTKRTTRTTEVGTTRVRHETKRIRAQSTSPGGVACPIKCHSWTATSRAARKGKSSLTGVLRPKTITDHCQHWTTMRWRTTASIRKCITVGVSKTTNLMSIGSATTSLLYYVPLY